MAEAQEGDRPESRRAGGRGAGLSRERVLDAAVELMDRNGVDWLTMRRLAADLGVQAGALYWHFENKDALCRAVVERLAADEHLDPVGERAAGGSPRAHLEGHLRGMRAHWRAHASVLALGRRFPPTTVGAVSQRGTELVTAMTGDADGARETYRALVWTVLGFVMAEDGVAASSHHRPVAGSTGLYEVDVGTGEPPWRLDTDALFGEVLGLALDGLAARRARRPPRGPSTRR